MYAYTVFGLTIHSDFCLSSLLPDAGRPADVVITRGTVDLPDMQPGLYGLSFHIRPDVVYIRWDTIGNFRMTGGREIVVAPDPGVSDELIRGFIIGSGLGATLYLRGQLVLHASAVAGDQGVVAFIGESGWGKSTIAASLHACGARLVADDLVVIDQVDGQHIVYPGLPEFRLWPDSIASLGEQEQHLPKVHPSQEKRVRRVHTNMQQAPGRLHRLYILGFGDTHAITPLKPATAALELVCFTYGVEVFHAIAPRQHFLHCTALAQDVPVLRLQRRMALDALPALIAMLEDDIRHAQ